MLFSREGLFVSPGRGGCLSLGLQEGENGVTWCLAASVF